MTKRFLGPIPIHDRGRREVQYNDCGIIFDIKEKIISMAWIQAM
jgi:hypothetical protein